MLGLLMCKCEKPHGKTSAPVSYKPPDGSYKMWPTVLYIHPAQCDSPTQPEDISLHFLIVIISSVCYTCQIPWFDSHIVRKYKHKLEMPLVVRKRQTTQHHRLPVCQASLLSQLMSLTSYNMLKLVCVTYCMWIYFTLLFVVFISSAWLRSGKSWLTEHFLSDITLHLAVIRRLVCI